MRAAQYCACILKGYWRTPNCDSALPEATAPRCRPSIPLHCTVDQEGDVRPWQEVYGSRLDCQAELKNRKENWGLKLLDLRPETVMTPEWPLNIISHYCIMSQQCIFIIYMQSMQYFLYYCVFLTVQVTF